MNKILEKISQNYSEIKEYDHSISNRCFLCDKKVILKITYDTNFPLIDDFTILDTLYQKGISAKYLSESTKKFSLVEILSDFKSKNTYEYTEKDLKLLLRALHNIHKLQSTSKPKSLLMIYNYYYSLLKHKEEYKDLSKLYSTVQTERYVYSHFDLVSDNILFKNNECRIIDFDLSVVTDYRFDLLSLITENDFNEDKKNYIIDNYFSSSREKKEFEKELPKLSFLFDYLWFIWSEARKSLAPYDYKKKYEKISLAKYNSAKKSLYNQINKII